MLEWMESLANALGLWNRKLTDGELILAWTNIGAIVECLMKLFLSIYYEDYKKDIDAIKKKRLLIEPDSLNLKNLRTFFAKKFGFPMKIGMNGFFSFSIEEIQYMRLSLEKLGIQKNC